MHRHTDRRVAGRSAWKTEPKGFTFQIGDLVVLSVRDSFVTGVRFVRGLVYLPDCLLRPLPMLH